MTLVDTNVLLDVATDDSQWAEWSTGQLETASLTGPLLINEVIYAELAVRYERIEAPDHFIEAAGLQMASFPSEALFLAGKVFTGYRRTGARELVCCPIFSLVHMQPFKNATSDSRCRALPDILSDGCADHSQCIVNGPTIKRALAAHSGEYCGKSAVEVRRGAIPIALIGVQIVNGRNIALQVQKDGQVAGLERLNL